MIAVMDHKPWAPDDHGVWIGSRMSENTLFMDCSDPYYDSGPVHRIHLDHAGSNTVRGNVFGSVEFGVRIEDDHNTVEDNVFVRNVASHRAISLGSLRLLQGIYEGRRATVH